MKNVIVIIDPKSSADYENILKDATEIAPIPPEVTQITKTAWLIDLHKSIGFFSGLLHSANIRKVDAFVFAVEDIIHFADRPGPDFIKINLDQSRSK
jgi:hypothetical protein